MINDLGQAFDARFERLFTVLVKEEFGVGQTRAYHALVATDHGGRIIGRDVADHQKLVRQLACGVQQRKVFLVRLHRENQALLRHVEELLFKFADQHIGALDQGGDFVQQSLVVNRTERAVRLSIHAVAGFGCSSLQLAHDLGASLGKAGDHGAVCFQDFVVLVGMRQHQRRDFGFKAVTLRAVAGCQAQRLDGHHHAAMQGDQAVRRAHKVHTAPAGQFAIGLQLVLHDFGDRQLGQRFLMRFYISSGHKFLNLLHA